MVNCSKESCNNHALFQEALQVESDEAIPEDRVLNHESIVVELDFETSAAVVKEVKNEPDCYC